MYVVRCDTDVGLMKGRLDGGNNVKCLQPERACSFLYARMVGSVLVNVRTGHTSIPRTGRSKNSMSKPSAVIVNNTFHNNLTARRTS